MGKLPYVASFTDAWIETLLPRSLCGCAWSHLLQMRGLKLIIIFGGLDRIVASFTDAWIETGVGAPTAFMAWVASFTDAWIETC